MAEPRTTKALGYALWMLLQAPLLGALVGCDDGPSVQGGVPGADAGGEVDDARSPVSDGSPDGPVDGPGGAPEDGLPPDLRARLEAIGGVVSVEELDTAAPPHRSFEIRYEQPLDHDDDDDGNLVQTLTLVHVDPEAPMVLVTEGYRDYQGDRLSELALLLGANQLVVEHRFYGTSQPDADPVPWQRLTIEQAARDVHRAVTALSPLYPAPWISTGASKSGMTALFHRRYFPDDVAGTVAYATPIILGLPDARFLDFFEQVGTEACRQRLRALQLEYLLRRPGIIELVRDQTAGIGFDIVGGIQVAFQASVAEFEWQFWQVHGDQPEQCENLPDPEAASDEVLVDLFVALGLDLYYADPILTPLVPYYFQVARELGAAALPRDHIDDLLDIGEEELLGLLVPHGVIVEYDATVMVDIRDWLDTSAEAVIMLYGENDPWTTARVGFDDGEADTRDVHEFIVPRQSHYVEVADLDAASRQTVCERLASWSGVSEDTCLNASEGAASRATSARARADDPRRRRRIGRR